MNQIRIHLQDSEGLPVELKFDPLWYRQTYKFLDKDSDEALRDHYLRIGQDIGHQPSPFFMPGFVRKQLQRLRLPTDGDLRKRYMENCRFVDPHIYLPRTDVGFRSIKASSGHLDGSWYNFSAYVLRNLDHAGTRHSLYFDPSFLAAETGRITDAPLRDHLWASENIHLQTSALFDPVFYAAQSDEVASECQEPHLYLNALDHFRQEGMYRDLAPFADFDLDYYKRSNPDIETVLETDPSINSWVQHFMQIGLLEGRNPNKYFDASYYVEAQPDVLGEINRLGLTCPFEHFLKIGYQKGLKANRPLHTVEIPEIFGKSLYEKRCQVTTSNLLGNQDTIRFPELSGKPVLSCIIPVIDQFHMTIHLLDQLSSICWRRDMPQIEVILVDNGSQDLTRQISRYVSNVVIEQHQEKLGYPKACNIGARVARGEILLFMNNDIEVTASSILKGIQSLSSNPDTGAVGARLIRMNGTLQEAGNIIFRNGSCFGFGRDDDPTEARFNVPREVDYCSGCFLFVDANAFNDLGGFDEVYSPGYYEEADLCARLKAAGLKTIYDPSVFAYHYEYASYSKGRSPSTSTALMRRNQKQFVKRHREHLQDAATQSGAILNARIAASRAKPTVAIVEDFMPDPSLGSGFGRTLDVAIGLLGEGFKVSVFVLHYKESRLEDQLRNLGVEVIRVFDYAQVSSIFQGREWDFDIVWVCRTHNFKRLAKDIEQLRGVNASPKVVFDTEAIAALRNKAFNALNHVTDTRALEPLVQEELIGSFYPDVIVTVNALDRQMAAQAIRLPIRELGHKMPARSAVPPIKGREGIFFCGSFHDRNSPNYDSIQWFLTEVWPSIREKMPDVEFRIAGYCAPHVELEKLLDAHPGVRYLGKVDNLAVEFDAARCFVAPTRYAGGVPHKVHEAMAMGCPVVCTDLLRRQLSTNAVAFEKVPVLSAKPDNPAAFAAACLQALGDETSASMLKSKALEYIKTNASDVSFSRQLRGVLGAL
ncbi:glycosyltransferase [uncultured Tateyamaria sp.]|uniref:glycosyltransferase n=1 Tax=uncultured Tateyamaria sp. TaxID=455651 RepID=UPI00260DA18F|nr:glycosyltransferase [uncultured Tateyamaria sp.]